MITASQSIWELKIKPPEFDTDELSEEKRFQICVRGMMTVPQLNILIKEDEKTSSSKYWTVTSMDLRVWRSKEENEVLLFIFNAAKIRRYGKNLYSRNSISRFYKHLNVQQRQKCTSL